MSSILKTDFRAAAGKTVFSQAGQKIRLASKISAGGEGEIFLTDSGMAAKIYYPQNLRQETVEKLKLMLSRKVDIPGVCWPTDLLLDQCSQVIGYLMPKAEGKTLQHSVFSKPLLLQHFPDWKRSDLVTLALSCLKRIKRLHIQGILLGDINPLNFLVKGPEEVWLVDTDSYQIGQYCCPVGTVNFTPPELQGRDFKTFLRTAEHEYFAVATLAFMILLPGKPPYAHCGGGSPGENIARMEFSYPCGEKSNGKAPDGPWRYIWSNLSFKMKETFYKAFRDNRRFTVDELGEQLYLYKTDLERGFHSNELFPEHLKMIDPVSVVCNKCGRQTRIERQRLEHIKNLGKSVLCPSCMLEIKLQKNATQSTAAQQTSSQSTARLRYRSRHNRPAVTNMPNTIYQQLNSCRQPAGNLFTFAIDLIASLFK